MKLKLRGKLILTVLVLINLLANGLLMTTDQEIFKLVKNDIAEKLNADANLGYRLVDEMYKGTWSVREGKLYKGEKSINDDFVLVDEIKRLTGSLAAFYLGDTVVSASTTDKNGSRGTGSKISTAAAAAVLKEGKSYYGEIELSGGKYLDKLTPIKDEKGEIIGIWAVGINAGAADEKRNNTRILGAVIALCGCVVSSLVFIIFANRLVGSIKKAVKTITVMASGDFSSRAEVRDKDELGDIARNLNIMADSVNSLLREARGMSNTVAASARDMTTSAFEISKASEQVSSSIGELARGASEQAVSTETSSKQIHEIVASLEQIAEGVANTEALADQAKENISAGEQSLQIQDQKVKENRRVSERVGSAIAALSQKSDEIGQIVSVIRDVAEHTNLLALNAAIEAARAGEQGKGFAVVADEIRKLSEQSNQSVKRIAEIIKEVQEGVTRSVKEMELAEVAVEEQESAMGKTLDAFRHITGVVDQITSDIKTVSETSRLLSGRARTAGEHIGEIASIAEETAAVTEQVSASTEEQTAIINQITQHAEQLSSLAERLNQSILKFIV